MDGLSSKWTLLGRDWGAESVPRLCVCVSERGREKEKRREFVSIWISIIFCMCAWSYTMMHT